MAVGVWRLPGLVAALCRCARRSATDTDNRKNWLEEQEGRLSTFPTCRSLPTGSGACRFGDNTQKGPFPLYREPTERGSSPSLLKARNGRRSAAYSCTLTLHSPM